MSRAINKKGWITLKNKKKLCKTKSEWMSNEKERIFLHLKQVNNQRKKGRNKEGKKYKEI